MSWMAFNVLIILSEQHNLCTHDISFSTNKDYLLSAIGQGDTLRTNQSSFPVRDGSVQGVILWTNQSSVPVRYGSDRGVTLWTKQSSFPVRDGSVQGVILWTNQSSVPVRYGSDRGVTLWTNQSSFPVRDGSDRGVTFWTNQSSFPVRDGSVRAVTLWTNQSSVPVRYGSDRGVTLWTNQCLIHVSSLTVYVLKIMGLAQTLLTSCVEEKKSLLVMDSNQSKGLQVLKLQTSLLICITLSHLLPLYPLFSCFTGKKPYWDNASKKRGII